MNQPILENRVVLIIGAGRPPAPALIHAFAQQGAILAINDLSPVLLDPVVASAPGDGKRIRSYVADATRGMPLRAMIDEVLSDWGRIDVLINNPRIQPTAPLFTMDEWDWQRTIEMNLNGPFLVSQLTARLMQEQGQGVILNIVDTNLPALEAVGNGAYAASQQGLLTLSQAAAREFIAYNIRVHTLCPDDAIFNPAAAENTIDPGKILAELAVYLCSESGQHLTGQMFRIDQTQITPLPDTL